MFGWFTGLTTLGKSLLVAVALIGLYIIVHLIIESIEDNGRNEVIVEHQKGVIEDVKAANEVREELPNRSPAERNADCLRRSRTPELC